MNRHRTVLAALSACALMAAAYAAAPAAGISVSKLGKKLGSLTQRVTALESKAGTPGPQGPQGLQGIQGVQGASSGFTFMGNGRPAIDCNPGPCFAPADGLGAIITSEAPVTLTTPNVQLTARDLVMTIPAQHGNAIGLSVVLRVNETDDGLSCTSSFGGCDSGSATDVIPPGAKVVIKITSTGPETIPGDGISVGWRAVPAS